MIRCSVTSEKSGFCLSLRERVTDDGDRGEDQEARSEEDGDAVEKSPNGVRDHLPPLPSQKTCRPAPALAGGGTRRFLRRLQSTRTSSSSPCSRSAPAAWGCRPGRAASSCRRSTWASGRAGSRDVGRHERVRPAHEPRLLTRDERLISLPQAPRHGLVAVVLPVRLATAAVDVDPAGRIARPDPRVEREVEVLLRDAREEQTGRLSGRNSMPAALAWACRISSASSRSRLPAVAPKRTEARWPAHTKIPSLPLVQLRARTAR